MIGIYVTVPIACFRKGLAREFLETEPLPPPSTCYGFLLSLVGETDRHRHVGCRVAPVLLGEPSTSTVLRTTWRIKAANGWKGTDGHWFVLGDNDRKALRKWLASVVAERSELLFSLDRSEEEQSASWKELAQTWIVSGKPKAEDTGQSKDVTGRAKKWVTKYSAFVPVPGSGQNASPDYQQLLSHIQLVIWLDSTDDAAIPNLEARVTQALTDPSQVTRFGGLSLGESTHLVDEVSLMNSERRRRLEGEMSKSPRSHVSARAFLLKDDGNMTLPVWVDHVGSAGTRYCTGHLKETDLSPPNVDDLPVIRPLD